MDLIIVFMGMAGIGLLMMAIAIGIVRIIRVAIGGGRVVIQHQTARRLRVGRPAMRNKRKMHDGNVSERECERQERAERERREWERRERERNEQNQREREERERQERERVEQRTKIAVDACVRELEEHLREKEMQHWSAQQLEEYRQIERDKEMRRRNLNRQMILVQKAQYEVLVMPDGTQHCIRASGKSLRAWFRSKEEAEAFARNPENTAYHGDVAHLCRVCDFWHLSKLEWLA